MSPFAETRAISFSPRSAYQSSQESHAGRDIRQALVASLALDGQPTAILDLFQHPQQTHPVDVAVPQGDLAARPASAGLVGVLGMNVHDPAAQGLSTGVGVEATQQEVG